MTLEDVAEHAENIRAMLVVKKRQLDHMTTGTPESVRMIRYQIDCLEPRLDELDRQVRRMTRERDAAATPQPLVIIVP